MSNVKRMKFFSKKHSLFKNLFLSKFKDNIFKIIKVCPKQFMFTQTVLIKAAEKCY